MRDHTEMDAFTESTLERFPRIDPKVLADEIAIAVICADRYETPMVVVQALHSSDLWCYGSDLRRKSDTSRVIVVVEPDGLVRYAPQGGAH